MLVCVCFVTFVLLLSSLSYCDAHISHSMLSFAGFLLFVNCLFIIKLTVSSVIMSA